MVCCEITRLISNIGRVVLGKRGTVEHAVWSPLHLGGGVLCDG